MAAYHQFNSWANARGLHVSQSTFKCLALKMHKQTDWPGLKGKAHNSAVVSEWLAEVAAEHQFDDASSVRSDCLGAFVGIWKMVQNTKWPDWRMNDSQCAELEELRSTALLSYHWLSKTSCEAGAFRYRMRPKFHHLDEGLRRSVRTGVSMSIYYSFTPEDCMGVVARMCRHIHPSSIMRRGVSRWLLSFFTRFK